MNMPHRCVVLLCADLFIFDLPTGVVDAAWDSRTYTRDELIQLLQAFREIQAKPAWFVFFWCGVSDTNSVSEALKADGYIDINPIYWFKTNLTATGPLDRHINAVEIVITARFTGGVAGALHTNLPQIPFFHEDPIWADCTKDYLEDWAGDKVNICQKPLQVYEQLLPVFLKPGAQVLVAGFGAGGEIGACIAGGYNCVAFESDPIQFKAVSTWLLNHDARVAENNANRLARGAMKDKAKAKRVV